MRMVNPPHPGHFVKTEVILRGRRRAAASAVAHFKVGGHRVCVVWTP